MTGSKVWTAMGPRSIVSLSEDGQIVTVQDEYGQQTRWHTAECILDELEDELEDEDEDEDYQGSNYA
jgi:uncharacterized protein YwgA